MSEIDVQNSIRLELSKLGYFTERINVGCGYLVPKELMEKIKRACPHLKAELDKISYFSTGAVKGRSDISAIKDGKIAFLEIKNERGRPTTEQLNFIKQMKERYGCRAGIARSVDDAIAIVKGDNDGN